MRLEGKNLFVICFITTFWNEGCPWLRIISTFISIHSGLQNLTSIRMTGLNVFERTMFKECDGWKIIIPFMWKSKPNQTDWDNSTATSFWKILQVFHENMFSTDIPQFYHIDKWNMRKKLKRQRSQQMSLSISHASEEPYLIPFILTVLPPVGVFSTWAINNATLAFTASCSRVEEQENYH